MIVFSADGFVTGGISFLMAGIRTVKGSKVEFSF